MTAAQPSRARRLRLTRLAVVGLLLLPVIEIVVIVAVGSWIGGWPTFLLLVATSLLGAWLIRREGGRAWRALQQAVRDGRMPAREIADGVVVLVGGSLLLLPGFVTDLLGLVLVLPFTRPIARSLLAAVISRRLLAQTERLGGPAVTGARASGIALPSDVAVDAEVDLGQAGDGFLLQARLKVSLPGLDPVVARTVVDGAHQLCPYSKATRGNIAVELSLA